MTCCSRLHDGGWGIYWLHTRQLLQLPVGHRVCTKVACMLLQGQSLEGSAGHFGAVSVHGAESVLQPENSRKTAWPMFDACCWVAAIDLGLAVGA